MINEKIELNKAAQEIVITKEHRIPLKNVNEAKEIQQKLESELRNIVQQVKQLKARAEEIKSMLDALKGADIIESAPSLEISRSLSVE